MGLIPAVLPPDVKAALGGVPGMQEDLTAIRGLLERLVELEEWKAKGSPRFIKRR